MNISKKIINKKLKVVWGRCLSIAKGLYTEHTPGLGTRYFTVGWKGIIFLSSFYNAMQIIGK